MKKFMVALAFLASTVPAVGQELVFTPPPVYYIPTQEQSPIGAIHGDARNMIYNGNLRRGDEGIYPSPYFQKCEGWPCSWSARTWGVAEDASKWHPLFIRSGRGLVVNGNGNFDKYVTVPSHTFTPMWVVEGQVYDFSADLKNVCCGDFERVGTNASVDFGLITPTDGNFRLLGGATATTKGVTVSGRFRPNFTGYVMLAIRNNSFSKDDNDFMVYNLYFGAKCNKDHDHRRHDVLQDEDEYDE